MKCVENKQELSKLQISVIWFQCEPHEFRHWFSFAKPQHTISFQHLCCHFFLLPFQHT